MHMSELFPPLYRRVTSFLVCYGMTSVHSGLVRSLGLILGLDRKSDVGHLAFRRRRRRSSFLARVGRLFFIAHRHLVPHPFGPRDKGKEGRHADRPAAAGRTISTVRSWSWRHISKYWERSPALALKYGFCAPPSVGPAGESDEGWSTPTL